MNDIGQRDIETYLRNLISETFDSQSENTKCRGPKMGDKSSKTSASKPGRPEAAQEYRPPIPRGMTS